MGQLGGFSLVIHLAIILLSALSAGFEKLVKTVTFYFSWLRGKQAKVRLSSRFLGFLK